MALSHRLYDDDEVGVEDGESSVRLVAGTGGVPVTDEGGVCAHGMRLVDTKVPVKGR